jgi:hypothetical protein
MNKCSYVNIIMCALVGDLVGVLIRICCGSMVVLRSVGLFWVCLCGCGLEVKMCEIV